MTKLLPKAHWEIQKGTNEQARAYTQKISTRKPNTDPYERGTFTPGQGSRTDLATVTAALKEGKDMVEAIGGNPEIYVKYHKGLQAY